jgi:sugar/nucleoside kinase (ribokinase family)
MATGDHDFETGRCMVLVSPDGERSMNTYLGVSEYLSPSDIDERMMATADWLYLEGYRFDGPDSHEAFARAIAACKGGGGRASVTLSDPFCVDRHRDAFRRMIRDDLDLLFANEAEVMSLYQTASLEEALEACAAEVHFAAVTVGPDGAWVIQDGSRTHVPTIPARVVDATGAGDMFAAGFLHGLAQGRDPVTCARMGSVAAAEIIGHIGARPEVDLKALMAGHGL